MAESVELPLHYLPDGSPFVVARDVAERPEVARFLRLYCQHWRTLLNIDAIGGGPDDRLARDPHPLTR